MKYLIQYFFIMFLFLIFKLFGLKLASILSAKIFSTLGPIFRSNSLIHKNLQKVFPQTNKNDREKIVRNMWINYGKILAEYVFIKDFRNSPNFSKKITIENQNVLEKINQSKKPVIFISGHFNNFELMAMHIEKSGIKLAAVYRPLNNIFLNPVMEKIRKNYICKNQIKKGISGTKDLLKCFKNKTSIALMIDQRVSEGIKCDLFNFKASTTTIPAQFVKKFDAEVVPIYIERVENNDFKIKIYNALSFSKDETIETITLKLNKILEEMIVRNPDQWIWTHNRWK